MSVGGKVIEVLDCGDRVWVNTRKQVWDSNLKTQLDPRCVAKGCKCSECAAYIERTDAALLIEPGDSLWWQGRDAMWTPRAGGKPDRKLRRIGYSGVRRDTAITHAAAFRADAIAGEP
jgi:hypothetical protein